MKFTPAGIDGAWIIDIEPHVDERGLFARTFWRDEFARYGLPTAFVQCNISGNRKRGTLRGMHFQAEPMAEGKLVRCQRGAIFDAMVDLRATSPTYLRWVGFDLDEQTARALFIPAGCAHGFQTLTDDASVFYQMTEMYEPSLARGVRWNDPAFSIAWPLADPILSPRDATYPDFNA